MADKSKLRMNLAAIKKIDPYAKNIVSSSSHVAFYTFNSERNEWEKTDVEGALFIYSRNAQPYHSIFINNRLNTTSFVEPITTQMELQSQPPFLLYKNERSRIRGFWFYNNQECDRIGSLINNIAQNLDFGTSETTNSSSILSKDKDNIFKLLSKAQQEYSNSQNPTNNQQIQTDGSVLKFFAAAKPTPGDVPLYQKVAPNTLSVEQLEKQQRVHTPLNGNELLNQNQKDLKGVQLNRKATPQVDVLSGFQLCTANKFNKLGQETTIKPQTDIEVISTDPTQFTDIPSIVNKESNIMKGFNICSSLLPLPLEAQNKTALIPPTMFDKPSISYRVQETQQPLNRTQLVQAFSYLIQNDDEFVHKLHTAYMSAVLKQ